MSRILLFNKPYGVICQFSKDGLHPTLADYIAVPGVYPAGRLDTDSEGLLLLTDDGKLQHRITDPRHKLPKTYWVQVEGEPDEAALLMLRQGVRLKDGPTLPAEVRLMEAPAGLWQRDPPVRFRKAIPTSWISLTIREGRNRQGQAYDSGRGLSDFAPDPLPDRGLDAGWTSLRRMARAAGG